MDRGDLIIFGGIGVIVILVVVGFIAIIALSTPQAEFQARDAIVQECMKSERYTFDQCVILASGED